jgi:hypothetical protein
MYVMLLIFHMLTMTVELRAIDCANTNFTLN